MTRLITDEEFYEIVTEPGFLSGCRQLEAEVLRRVAAEIERLRAEHAIDPCKDGSCSCCWVDEPSEIERLRVDAERYRWLRDKSGGWFAKDEGDWSLDAAIDVARIEK